MLTHGSLFAGIGGYDLGFERAGIKTVWQVEIEDYCRRVLTRHFPHAKRYDDIRRVGKHNLEPVEVISGGFPCQDISNAGKRAGIDGERSGLWSEMHRVIRELRPRYVVVENVAALLGRGMERVLGDLAKSGYDAEWQSIRASDFGAPHRRERIWILAYPNSQRGYGRADEAGREHGWPEQAFAAAGARRPILADPPCERAGGLSVRPWRPLQAAADAEWSGEVMRLRNHWAVEPDVGRVAHGIPARVDRLRGLGNSVVSQIAEWIGKRIIEATEQSAS